MHTFLASVYKYDIYQKEAQTVLLFQRKYCIALEAMVLHSFC